MPMNWYRPKPGRFGTAPLQTEWHPGDGAQSITASSTTSYYLATPYRKAYVDTAAYQASAVVTPASGSVTAILKKVCATGSTVTAVSSAINIGSATALVNYPFTFGTISAADRTLALGDVLKVDIIASSTITTPHSDPKVTVCLDVI